MRNFNERGENDNVETSISEEGIQPFAYLGTMHDLRLCVRALLDSRRSDVRIHPVTGERA